MSGVDWNEVVPRLYPALHSRALRLTGDWSRAQDLVQATWERLLGADPELSPDSVLPWLMVVMRHLFIDSRRAPEARWLALHAGDHPDRRSGDSDDDKEALASAKVRLEDVDAALPALSETLRHPYEMHLKAHLSYREIAVLLHIDMATVGTRIHRARRQLRQILLPLTRGVSHQLGEPSGRRADWRRVTVASSARPAMFDPSIE